MSQRRPWITARWDGWCRGCGRPYEAGQMIIFDTDEDGFLATCCGGDDAGGGSGLG